MKIVWMRSDRRHGNIVLEVFGWVGLVVGEIWNFELVGVGEEHRWLDDGANISL